MHARTFIFPAFAAVSTFLFVALSGPGQSFAQTVEDDAFGRFRWGNSSSHSFDCSPIVCSDGAIYPRCINDVPLNYFHWPCGPFFSSSSSSSRSSFSWSHSSRSSSSRSSRSSSSFSSIPPGEDPDAFHRRCMQDAEIELQNALVPAYEDFYQALNDAHRRYAEEKIDIWNIADKRDRRDEERRADRAYREVKREADDVFDDHEDEARDRHREARRDCDRAKRDMERAMR